MDEKPLALKAAVVAMRSTMVEFQRFVRSWRAAQDERRAIHAAYNAADRLAAAGDRSGLVAALAAADEAADRVQRERAAPASTPVNGCGTLSV